MTENYVETYWMKHAGVKPLSDEEKVTLRATMVKYQEDKEKLKSEIVACETKIRELNSHLENILPSIPGAKYVHDRGWYGKYYGGCGMRTAIFDGTTPSGGAAGGDDTYWCMFCEEGF